MDNFSDPDAGAAQSTEEALAESQRRLQIVLDASRLGLWEWDIETGRMRHSRQALAILGVDRQAQVPDAMAARRLVHPEDVEVIWVADEALSAGRPFDAEYRIVRPDGVVRWVANHARIHCDTHGRPVRMVGTLADISERKHAEEALRVARDELEARVHERTAALALSNAALVNEVAERRAIEAQARELFGQLVTTEEEERRRLARELHDSLGQHVTALDLGLAAVAQDASLPAALRERVSQLRRTARRLDTDIDRLVYQLRPTVLDDLGLDDALREHARTWAEETGIVVDLHVALRGRRFPPALETTVYRVVQEALNNVRKHAGANRVGLIVERRGGELRAIVEDDGRGFEPAARQVPSGPGRQLGLRGMAERAAQAGGRLEVESATGRGTTVYLALPLAPDAPPA